jgi:hypothetical protein
MVKLALLKIPDDLPTLAAVGRIALRHSQLNRVLRLTIKDSDKREFKKAMKPTRRTPSGKLLKCVRELVMQKAGDGRAADLNALLDGADRATKDRNHILHSLWAEHNGSMVIEHDEGVEARP